MVSILVELDLLIAIPPPPIEGIRDIVSLTGKPSGFSSWEPDSRRALTLKLTYFTTFKHLLPQTDIFYIWMILYHEYLGILSLVMRTSQINLSIILTLYINN